MDSTIELLAGDCTADTAAGLPMAGVSVPAGFPSPADDWIEERLDLYKMLVEHPACTFYARSKGDSMRDEGIRDGDILVVDRALTAAHGDVVIAVVDNEFTTKKLYDRAGIVKLQPANPTYAEIVPKEGQTLEIWGVVTASVTLHSKRSHVRTSRRK